MAAALALSCGAFAASEPPHGSSFLAFVALVPWLVVAPRATWVGALASGWCLGTFGGALTAYWVPDALQAVGANGPLAWFGLLVVCGWVSGLPFALLGVAVWLARSMPTPIWVAIAAAAIFSIDAGRSDLPIGVPWMLLGHSQHDSPGIAQLAVVGGVPLVSAVVMACNAAIARCLVAAPESNVPSRAYQTSVAVLAAILLLGLAGLPLAEYWHGTADADDHLEARVLLIQPNVPVEERWDPGVQSTNLARAADLTRRALGETPTLPDVIVWPETTLTTPLDRTPLLSGALQRIVDDLRIPLIVGVTRSARALENRYRNAAQWLEPGRGMVSEVEKNTSVPIVEAGTFVGLDASFYPFIGAMGRGPRVEDAPLGDGLRSESDFGVALCYEIVFPSIVATRTSRDAQAILNLANDSWLSHEGVSRQQIAFATFRAVENRRHLLRNAHGGISAVIDPFGRVLETYPMGKEGWLSVSFIPASPPCVSEKVSFIALPLLAGALAWLAFGIALRRTAMPRLRSALFLILTATLASGSTRAEEARGTLTLDGLSFISFQDQQNLLIPSGSTLHFRFGERNGDGSVPIRLEPADVALGPIPLPGGGGTLRYGLARTATGKLLKTRAGTILELQAVVSVRLEKEGGGGTAEYPIRFTTEAASAADGAGVARVKVEGARLDLAGRYLQLVGATTNRGDAYPEPGKAVYTVLSGTFDWLPTLQ